MAHATQPLFRSVPDEPSFEDSLRELVRNAPYLGLALLVHGLVLLILLNIEVTEPPVDPVRVIQMTPPEIIEPLPPEPELPPVPAEVDPIEPEFEPTVSEVPMEAEADPSNAGLSDYDDGLDGVMITGAGTGSDEPGDGIGGDKIGGGPPNTTLSRDDPVRHGLQWLAHHQGPDGFWSCAGFDAMCGRQGSDTTCDGTGNPQFDVGVTGLSLLAFLGAGQTHRSGEFKDTVRSAIRALIDIQADDGNFGLATNPQHTYDHAIATLAITEAFARTGDRLLRDAATDGLAYLTSIRNPGGAWRYAPHHPEMIDPATANDTSVTGWVLLALTLGKDAGLPVDDDAIADALDVLDELTDAAGRTGYTARGTRSPREAGREDLWPDTQTEALTAVAVLCRIFADPDLVRPGNEQAVRRGVQLIAALPPAWNDDDPGRVDFYFWYYGTYALYQFDELDSRPWEAWEDALVEAVVTRQHTTGERRGSWDPQADPWGHLGGRVYSTALLTLCLEVYYRYAAVLAPPR